MGVQSCHSFSPRFTPPRLIVDRLSASGVGTSHYRNPSPNVKRISMATIRRDRRSYRIDSDVLPINLQAVDKYVPVSPGSNPSKKAAVNAGMVRTASGL